MNDQQITIGDRTIILNERVIQGISEIQDDDEDIMLEGIDMLEDFVHGSQDSNPVVTLGHLATLNCLRRVVRKIRHFPHPV